MNRHRSAAAAAAARLGLVALLFLGACSKGDAPSPSKPTTTKPAADIEAGEMPKLENAKGAFRSLDVSTCDAGPGKVSANGTIENSAKKPRDLVIAVSWVNPKGNGVLDRKVVVIKDLAAGKSADWKVTGEVPSKTKATCAFMVKSGTLP
jgi:hypothetical protein